MTQLALQRGTQMIIVLEQGYVSSGVVTRSLPYLLEQPAAGGDGSRAIVVINRVINDSRAGALDVLRAPGDPRCARGADRRDPVGS